MLESLSVEENILLPMILDKREAKEQEHRLKKVLEMVGIEELADRGITELSGGQKHVASFCQRVLCLQDGGLR